jgi:hypothetical protein
MMQSTTGGKTAMKYINFRVPFLHPAAKRSALTIVFCLHLLALPRFAWAQISAAYQHIGSTDIVIKIEVGNPPPASLILVQKLPPGISIVHADPPVEKVNHARGEAKWLFRQLRPEPITVSFSVDRKISPTEISGQIRFKSNRGGGMENLPVSKP